MTAQTTVEAGYGAVGYGDGAYGDPESPAPTLADDTVTLRRGETVTVDVLGNDSGFDGSIDSYTVVVQTAPSVGTASVNADGTIDYAHDGSETATDSFTYTVTDDGGSVSTAATVSVTVKPPEQAPYVPHDLARIRAEDFDTGGEGVAYHDTTSGNNGGAYRDTDVDIQATSDDGGGYNVGWIKTGEWWEYTVEVPADGTYDIVARLAGKNPTSLDVAVDGSRVATTAVPNTEGWQSWTTVDVGTTSLTAGTHTVRLTANGGRFNINWFGFTLADETPPTTPTGLGADAVGESTVELSWDGSSDTETGVEAYTVVRDGTTVDTVTDGTTATVSGLSPETTYDFSVTAVDGADNESDGSNTVTVTTDAVAQMVRVTGDGTATYNDGTSVRYILETTGSIGPGRAGDLEEMDRAGGPSASGDVAAGGGEADTYALVDGTLTDVTTWGGDVTVTVDGEEWSG